MYPERDAGRRRFGGLLLAWPRLAATVMVAALILGAAAGPADAAKSKPKSKHARHHVAHPKKKRHAAHPKKKHHVAHPKKKVKRQLKEDPAGTVMIFGSSVPRNGADPDTKSVELGVKLKSSKAGYILGLRFYKFATNTGTHTGALWSSAGAKLASVTFTSESNSGWQRADFDQPVKIAASTTYVASYHASHGRNGDDEGYFKSSKTNAPLTALGSNYVYSSGTTFPTKTYNDTNYYVDVVYSPTAPVSSPTPEPTPQPVSAEPPTVAPPSATYTYAPSSPHTGDHVTFDGSGSSCAAAPCSYHWHDVGSGGTDDYPLGDGKTIAFTFQNVGTKYIQLVVTDASGRVDSATQAVDVTAPASPTPTPTPTATPSPTPAPAGPPSASYRYSPSSPSTGDEVTFDGSGSSCPASPCSYHWHDVGAGGTDDYSLGDGKTIAFTFQNVGTKYIQLVVTDAQGRVDSATQAIDVTSSASPTPSPTPSPSPTPTPTPSPTPSPSPTPPPTPSGSCDLNATASNFASQVSAASPGQTICLAGGSYGTWQGVSKAITIRPQAGASPTMAGNFGNGDASFTVNGVSPDGSGHLSVTSLDIRGTPGPSNIAIINARFTNSVTIDGPTSTNHANILLDHDDFSWNSTNSGPAKILLPYNTSGHSGVTVRHSYFANGDADGIQTGAALDILNNEFTNLCDIGANHTDNIQFVYGSNGGRIAGNYIHEPASCTTQGLTSYDGGTVGVTVEDNVVDIHRAWGIEFYADKNSIIRHNTVRYYGGSCYYNGPCGGIDINRKSADPAGSGTQVYDNIATVTVNNGSTTSRNDHNLNNAQVSYVGPTTAYNGYKLTTTSSGHAAADDGTDDGARIP